MYGPSPLQEASLVATVDFTLDGVAVSVDADPAMPLLYAIRNDLGHSNPHFGCGLAQCGACTVHLDGVPLRSCVAPLSGVAGRKVTTIKGLGTPERPHPVQQAYIEEQVPQCGYCVNGWIMTAAALLRDNPHASDAEIRKGLTGLKCRCGTHMSIMRAVKRAQQLMATQVPAASDSASRSS
jgi:aerobic-type carbon monoxide dehydrogenase small subunit (CoxS/CutS family)